MRRAPACMQHGAAGGAGQPAGCMRRAPRSARARAPPVILAVMWLPRWLRPGCALALAWCAAAHLASPRMAHIPLPASRVVGKRVLALAVWPERQQHSCRVRVRACVRVGVVCIGLMRPLQLPGTLDSSLDQCAEPGACMRHAPGMVLHGCPGYRCCCRPPGARPALGGPSHLWALHTGCHTCIDCGRSLAAHIRCCLPRL
jgi:hypothetical protein